MGHPYIRQGTTPTSGGAPIHRGPLHQAGGAQHQAGGALHQAGGPLHQAGDSLHQRTPAHLR